MNETVDITARHGLEMLQQQINAHERYCEAQNDRREAFEGDTKTTLAEIKASIQSSTGRVHARLDKLILSVLGGTILIMLSLVAYIYTQGVGQ